LHRSIRALANTATAGSSARALSPQVDGVVKTAVADF
jgi:hypothetical protein